MKEKENVGQVFFKIWDRRKGFLSEGEFVQAEKARDAIEKYAGAAVRQIDHSSKEDFTFSTEKVIGDDTGFRYPPRRQCLFWVLAP